MIKTNLQKYFLILLDSTYPNNIKNKSAFLKRADLLKEFTMLIQTAWNTDVNRVRRLQATHRVYLVPQYHPLIIR